MEKISIIILAIVICVVIFIASTLVEGFFNRKWHKKTMQNFSFWYKGKLFWYSRSVAVTLFTFCKNEANQWCVLANLRGSGTPDFQNHWNVPCGYLDFNETGEEASKREVFEETNVNVPLDNISLLETDTSPKLNRQNVSLRYCATLDGLITDYPLSKANMEKNEVDDIKWIPIDSIDNYKWAFGHLNDIKRIARKLEIG